MKLRKEQLDKREVLFSDGVLNVVDEYIELPNFNPTTHTTHMVNSPWVGLNVPLKSIAP